MPQKLKAKNEKKLNAKKVITNFIGNDNNVYYCNGQYVLIDSNINVLLFLNLVRFSAFKFIKNFICICKFNN